MTHGEFLRQVKETVSIQTIPPIYDPNKWKNKSFNCYAYALQVCMDCSNFWIGPGFISTGRNSKCNCTKEYILQYFKKDCEALGLQISPSKVTEPIGINEYKIAIYIKENCSFHFARQDHNGTWSEKIGWLGEIGIVESVTENKNGFEFIGVFRVSKKVG